VGRTIPSYRMALEEELRRWDSFKKALKVDDREAFEDMVNACRLYASASGAAARPVVFEAVVVSILLSHHKALMRLWGKVGERLDSRPLP
jgi:hypothetical protein